ncbi:hypothetical protein Dsin_013885 [Dipteronia sinensis]|uniref:Uncharacterized protein n=1 Tax=Dipteronia sinensis TaxID=43782 RepID=A0AAE0ALT1_9ROSI|nr:hypothetical protein Dsin_013885 [Dipteronia sinensis]
MDPRVFGAIAKNGIPSFIRLVQEDEGILEQRTIGSLNTVLHLASISGHINLVMEIIKLRPEMAAAENKKLETPLHEACRKGNIEVAMLLLKTNPWLPCKFNSKNQSALFIACSNGHLNVVKLLLNEPWQWFVGTEEDGAQLNSLHVAASNGHAVFYFSLNIKSRERSYSDDFLSISILISISVKNKGFSFRYGLWFLGLDWDDERSGPDLICLDNRPDQTIRLY